MNNIWIYFHLGIDINKEKDTEYTYQTPKWQWQANHDCIGSLAWLLFLFYYYYTLFI